MSRLFAAQPAAYLRADGDTGQRRACDTGQRVPSIVFTKGGGLWLESIAAIGSDAVGLDWTMDIGRARQLVGDKVALQGNLDPNVLFAPPDAVAAETRRVLDAYGNLEPFKGGPMLQAVWRGLDATEQAMPELAINCARKGCQPPRLEELTQDETTNAELIQALGLTKMTDQTQFQANAPAQATAQWCAKV